MNQLKFIVMLYLAISHFGRGRGSWRDPVNNPARWEKSVDSALLEMEEDWKRAWKKGGASADVKRVESLVHKSLRELLVKVFRDLYPDSEEIFDLR